jgi:hypothetical protein
LLIAEKIPPARLGLIRLLNELFAESSWIQVMLGQGIVPQRQFPPADVRETMSCRVFPMAKASRSKKLWSIYRRTRPVSSSIAKRHPWARHPN